MHELLSIDGCSGAAVGANQRGSTGWHQHKRSVTGIARCKSHCQNCSYRTAPRKVARDGYKLDTCDNVQAVAGGHVFVLRRGFRRNGGIAHYCDHRAQAHAPALTCAGWRNLRMPTWHLRQTLPYLHKLVVARRAR